MFRHDHRFTAYLQVYVLVVTVAAAPLARRDHAAAADDGDVLWFFGGEGSTDSGTSLLRELWSYDIQTDHWALQSQGTGPYPRQEHVAVYAEGAIWIHGGWAGRPAGQLDDLWSYNISAGRWNRMNILAGPWARHRHVGVYASGRLWIHGGFGRTDLGRTSQLNDLWSYDIDTGNWTLQSEGMGPSPLMDHVAVYAEGVIWIYDGWGRDLWSYNISAGRWNLMNTAERPPRRYQHAIVSAGGLIWIQGGWAPGEVGWLDDVWAYDPSSGLWALKRSGSGWPKRVRYAAVSATGKLWIHGGRRPPDGSSDDDNGDAFLSDLWSLDLTTISWQVEHENEDLSLIVSLSAAALLTVCVCIRRLCSVAISRRRRWICKQVGCRVLCRFFTVLAIDKDEGGRPPWGMLGWQVADYIVGVLWAFLVPHAMSWGRMLPESTDVDRLVHYALLANLICWGVLAVCFVFCYLAAGVLHKEWRESSLSEPMYLGGFLLNADIRLVRLEYLQELVAEGRPLPRRQEAEHATVKATGQTVLVSHAEMLACAEKLGRSRSGHMASPIIVVSHCWETREHPDPWGYQLETIVRSLQKLQPDESYETLGVFIDYSCLYQFKRKRRHEEESFRAAMKNMSLLYAHEWTQTLCVTDQTPESYKSSRAGSIPVYCPDEDEVQDRPITSLVPNTTEYELRGWCLAELQWSSLRTSEEYRNPLHASSALPNQHLWARRSPMAPYKFRSELAKKEIKFTHRSDFTPLIEAQQTAFHDKVSQCERLGFWDLSAAEMEILGEAVYFFPKVHTLKLERCAANVEGFIRNLSFSTSLERVYMHNAEIGDAEAKVIAGFLPSSRWSTIGLANNRIGDEGAADLAGALEVIGLRQTRSQTFLMDLRGNRIGESGVAALEVANSQQVAELKIGGQKIGRAAGSDGQAEAAVLGKDTAPGTGGDGLRADVSVAVADPPGCIADPFLL